MNSFTAIDFETAVGHHICAVGIVTVNEGVITDEFYALIQPPFNEYNRHNIQVHHITPEQTDNSPTFDQIYPEIKKRLFDRTIVAHNESFDRNVLRKTMEDYRMDYSELQIEDRWECTMKIYRAKGYKPAKLDVCCRIKGIQLNHREALSDARACALLYLKKKEAT